MTAKAKVIGIGLNKTATKSLALCFESLGYRNCSYSLDAFNSYRNNDWASLFDRMDNYDSFEDWPWPLMYREIDQHYPDAKFILTTRKNADTWYRSLCKMAVRMGPFNDFERHIYGWPMPQGRRDEHIKYYLEHNASVRNHFSDRPEKLLEICMEEGFDMKALTSFLGEEYNGFTPPHANSSPPVYDGESLWRAHCHRIIYQSKWYCGKWSRSLWHRLSSLFR